MAIDPSFIQSLAAAIEQGQALPAFPAGLSIDQAYDLQAQLTQRVFQGRAAGIKAGITTAAAQGFFGIDGPLIASLYQGRGLSNGAKIPSRPGASIECEIGIVVDKTGAVISAGPALEFVAIEFSQPEDFSLANILLANLAADRYLLGPQGEWLGDYRDVTVSLYRDEELLNQASVMDAIGGPQQALDWVLAEAKNRQLPMPDSCLLMTGSCGEPVPALPGKYRADYGKLGVVEFEVLAG